MVFTKNTREFAKQKLERFAHGQPVFMCSPEQNKQLCERFGICDKCFLAFSQRFSGFDIQALLVLAGLMSDPEKQTKIEMPITCNSVAVITAETLANTIFGKFHNAHKSQICERFLEKCQKTKSFLLYADLEEDFALCDSGALLPLGAVEVGDISGVVCGYVVFASMGKDYETLEKIQEKAKLVYALNHAGF